MLTMLQPASVKLRLRAKLRLFYVSFLITGLVLVGFRITTTITSTSTTAINVTSTNPWRVPSISSIIRAPPPVPAIPNKIWTYCDDESGHLPTILASLIEGWRWHNPHYDVTVIFPNTIANYTQARIPVNFWADHMKDHRPHWIKLAVLLEHGGFWIDSTTMLTGSLDVFRKRQARKGTEAFAFYLDYYTMRKELPVFETYFIATIAKGYWITSWFAEYNLAFGNFHCNDDYINFLKMVHGEDGYSHIVQNMQWQTYLKLNIASQKVLTLEGIPVPDGEEAEEGPYRILKECKYDDWDYARRLLLPVPRGEKLPLVVVLRSHTIKALNDILKQRSTLPPKTSIFGRYVMRFDNTVR
ncbi:hypothetical protein HDU67_005534 [Dinochytrium kinnereticum]|nr:hypothetical protein HDU67_005534 [Dinochytrium kinnereticum]